MPAHHSKPQLACTTFMIITAGFFMTPSEMGQSLYILSSALYNGNLACPGDEIIFVCETRGSPTIAWTSEVYIGQGGAQLQFAAGVSSISDIQHGIGSTTATLTGDRIENGVRILTSTLHVTALTMYPNPSVTCSHIGNDTSRTTNFNVIAPPNVPRDAIAVQLDHPIGNCAITTVWRGPDNLAESPLSNYTIIVNSSTPLLGDSVESVTEVNSDEREQFSSVIFVPDCGRYLISLRAINICGHTSPSVTIALNKVDCFILPDSVCMAENMHTSTFPNAPPLRNESTTPTASANKKNNAAHKPQGSFAVGLSVVASATITLHLQSRFKLTL